MAYVKIGGLRTLLKYADALIKQGARLRIVFGLSSRQRITDKESAAFLLKLSKRKNVVVKRWNSCRFHPKLLIFHGKHPSIVVGSANLTEAAQGANAEANILVEDADSQLMRDTLGFYEYYFNPAPILKPRDVDTYEPLPHTKSGVFHRGEKEDDLPSPPQRKHDLELLRPNKVWKIPPGRDARFWDEWLDVIDDDGEGIVAIGWDVGNLDDFKSYDSLKKAVIQMAKAVWDRGSDRKTDINYVTDQLWTFKTAISRGDVFIVYSETRVLGVAEVTAKSEYQYCVDPISFEHQLSVKYWWYKHWPKRADDKIVKALGRQGTLRPVEEDWLWDYLLKSLP